MAIQDDTPDAHRLKAIELRRAGRLDEALQHIQRALELRPDYPAGYYNLALVRLDQGLTDQAERAWRKAIEIKPDYHQAYGALSTALRRQGRHDEAIAAARKAVDLVPGSAEARLSLATALYVARKYVEAAAQFQECLKIDPKHVLALNNYANLLSDTDRPVQAAAYYRRALQLDPNQIEILGNFANVLKAQARVDDALACLRKVLKHNPSLWHLHSNFLLTLNCTPAADSGLLEPHRQWATQHADRFAPKDPAFANDRSPDRRLRIGYVSSDLRRHSVAYFMEPILQHHNRQNVEVFCYSNAEVIDAQTTRLRGMADQWRQIFGVNDDRVAQMIRDDQIDILVDLNGHTANHRLLVFARKPAPVQVSYLGYPNTTGLSTIDYHLTDEMADPPGLTDALHVERLIRLPAGAWCFHPAPDAPPPREQTETGNRPIVFGSFNNFAKVSQQTFDLWVKVLHDVPGSRLLIKAECLSDKDMRQAVHSEFIGFDIDPDRVELIGKEPSFQKHLLLYHKMDIALDTFPYHGTTTTCEAMWMGVPVITLAGRAHVSRVGASLLHRVGLGDLVASDPQAYVSIARELANAPARLRAMSGITLRQRMHASPLMDAKGFVAHLEQAYRQIWSEWCAA